MALSRNDYKIVDFSAYCGSCKSEKEAEIDSPCEECLDNSVNLHTVEPVNYKKKRLKLMKNTGSSDC